MATPRRRTLAIWTVAASQLACNELLDIEGATVGCVVDDHCGPTESCLASVCQALRPDAGAADASDASSEPVDR
jgi:hypothetical protein